MRLATLGLAESTSAVVILDDEKCGVVRELPGREDDLNVRSLIERPLSATELRQVADRPVPYARHDLLAPLTPPKNVLCVGKNYIAHAVEGARAEGRAHADIPTVPIWFTKAHTSLTGTGASIVPPEGFLDCLDYEGELAVIIGKRARGLTKESAMDVVFGFSVFNDVTARDVQQGRKQWFKGKSADTFAPMGPWIVTADEIPDPQTLRLVTRVNGEVRQDSNTAKMIFSVRDLLVDISQSITLEPGDIIATGTPEGVAWGMDEPKYLRPGDRVTVEISGVGVLENVVERPRD